MHYHLSYLITCLLFISCLSSTTAQPPGRGHDFPLLQAPSPGIAELHLVALAVSGRSGPETFSASRMLRRVIYRYDVKGRLVSSSSPTTDGSSEELVYEYEGGRLTRIVSGPEQYLGRKLLAVTYRKDTMIVTDTKRPQHVKKYVEGHLVEWVDGDERGNLVTRRRQLTPDRRRSTLEANGKRQLTVYCDGAADCRRARRAAPESDELILVESTPTGYLTTYPERGLTVQSRYLPIARADAERRGPVTSAESIAGAWRALATPLVLVVTNLPDDRDRESKRYESTRFITYDRAGDKRSRGESNFSGYFTGDGTFQMTGFGGGGRRSFSRVGDYLMYTQGDDSYLLERAPELDVVRQLEYGAKQELPPHLKYISPGWYQGLATAGGKELLSGEYKVAVVLSPDRFIVTTGESTARRYGLVDDKGRFLLPVEHFDLKIITTGRLLVSSTERQSIYDTDGNHLLPETTVDVAPALMGLIKVNHRDGGVQFLRQADLSPVAKKPYLAGSRTIGSGYAAGRTKRGWSVLSPEGELLFSLENVRSVHFVAYGVFLVRQDETNYQLVDETGEVFHRFTSDLPGAVSEAALVYWQGDHCGLLSVDGEQLTPATYELIALADKQRNRRRSSRSVAGEFPDAPTFTFRKDGRRGTLNHRGEEIQ